MKAIVSIYQLIPPGWKSKFWVVTAYFTLVALLETVGVASVMPFVALLSNPESAWRALEKSVIGHLLPAGIETWPVHWVGGGVIVLFLAANLLGFLSLWISARFSAHIGATIARNLAERYLAQGYLFLRDLGTAAAANDVTRETEKLVIGGILQLCLLTSKAIQALFVAMLLAMVSPLFTLGFCIISALFYAGLYSVLKKRAVRAGERLMLASAKAAQYANEMFMAAKDILVRQREAFFVNRFGDVCRRFYKAEAFARVVPTLPKYVIETTAFTALMIVPVYRSIRGEDYRSLLPIIALFAYAGYRILPALQQVYSSFTILKFYEALSNRISAELHANVSSETLSAAISCFQHEIQFLNVSYCYPQAKTKALDSFSLTIRKGEKLAVVGLSGAGKSTFLDILLGLLSIDEGELRVDGHSVGKRFAWADTVGYVPQAPFAISGTVAENIAFGIPETSIDMARCAEAARLAGLDQVISALPDGYQTYLGVRSNLSGGEVQRLAIARALYHVPALLVMDEPSSALDPSLSERIMSRLCTNRSDMTLVVVTHDWDLLRFFSRVVVVDKGHVVADGTFSELRDRLMLLRRSPLKNAACLSQGIE